MKYIFFLIFALCIAAPAMAAEVRTLPDRASARAGDIFTVTVAIDPLGAPLNVVEGAIKIPQGIDLVSVSTAGSALSLWTVRPTHVIADHSVVFTGGTTAVIPSATARLFTITAKARVDGTYTFEPAGIRAYQNDGAGTSVDVQIGAASIAVSADGLPSGEAETLPEESLVVEVGRDPSLFDGQYYVTFYGGDTGKGIAYYEIIEGDLEPVRATNFYVLKDQSDRSNITVRAVAPDGSYVSTTLEGGTNLLVVLVLLLLALCFIYLIYRIVKKIRS